MHIVFWNHQSKHTTAQWHDLCSNQTCTVITSSYCPFFPSTPDWFIETVITMSYLPCPFFSLFDEALMTPSARCNYPPALEMFVLVLTGHCCDHIRRCSIISHYNIYYCSFHFGSFWGTNNPPHVRSLCVCRVCVCVCNNFSALDLLAYTNLALMRSHTSR